jgi:hypothetical protein
LNHQLQKDGFSYSFASILFEHESMVSSVSHNSKCELGPMQGLDICDS